jgi:hypothetical protein
VASETDVINRALSKLGTSRCSSRMDEGKGPEEMNANYDLIRDAELRRNTWRFSLGRASLTALSSVPLGTNFTLEYQLPSDCLRLVQVAEFFVASLTDYRTRDESPFSLEGRKILTNYPAPLFIRYVKKITDASQFDAAFVESLASRLAYETCEAITGSSSKKDDLMKDYGRSLDEAVVANAIEVPPAIVLDESWVLARVS